MRSHTDDFGRNFVPVMGIVVDGDGPLRDFPSLCKRLLITLTECQLAVAGRPLQHV